MCKYSPSGTPALGGDCIACSTSGGSGPLAIGAIMRSVEETASLSMADGLALEMEIGQPIFSTNDSKEGARAFAEKRPANWTRT